MKTLDALIEVLIELGNYEALAELERDIADFGEAAVSSAVDELLPEMLGKLISDAIAKIEAAQTPKTHEGHNASRAVREASE